MEEHIHLYAVDRDEMSILGLMMERIIARSLARPEIARRARRIHGNLGVQAGRMTLTIAFMKDRILLYRGFREPLKAIVRGSLLNLLEVSVKRQPFGAFVSGRIAIKGNPLFALKVLPLFYSVGVKKDLVR